MSIESGDTKIEFKTSSNVIKFTFTKDGDIRLKFPKEMDEKDCWKWVRFAEQTRTRLGSIEKIYRGKVKSDDGYSSLILQNDAKKESITVPIDPSLWEIDQ